MITQSEGRSIGTSLPDELVRLPPLHRGEGWRKRTRMMAPSSIERCLGTGIRYLFGLRMTPFSFLCLGCLPRCGSPRGPCIAAEPGHLRLMILVLSLSLRSVHHLRIRRLAVSLIERALRQLVRADAGASVPALPLPCSWGSGLHLQARDGPFGPTLPSADNARLPRSIVPGPRACPLD